MDRNCQGKPHKNSKTKFHMIERAACLT